MSFRLLDFIDPLGRPTVPAGSDHCFHTCCPSVRTSVPTFQNLAKQKKYQVKTMFTTGKTIDLAEWIIDDTCLVCATFKNKFYDSCYGYGKTNYAPNVRISSRLLEMAAF